MERLLITGMMVFWFSCFSSTSMELLSFSISFSTTSFSTGVLGEVAIGSSAEDVVAAFSSLRSFPVILLIKEH